MRNRHLLALDTALLAASSLAAFALRFPTPERFRDWLPIAMGYAALALLARVGVLLALGGYRRLWRQASVSELELLATAAAVQGVTLLTLGVIAVPALGLAPQRIPLSVLALDFLMGAAAVTGLRLSLRAAHLRRARRRRSDDKLALIIGAGRAGEMIARELLAHAQLGLCPVGFLDDDRAKHRMRLQNLPVLGPIAALPRVVAEQNVGEVIIAMPSAPGTVVRSVMLAARAAGITPRTVPGLFEIISGRVGIAALRPVRIEDLLRREPVTIDHEQVRSLVSGHTVLVTGAGGSIGGELSRQIAALGPARLVLLGHGENSIFDMNAELREAHPALELAPVIADIRDRDRVTEVIGRFAPHVIFHAAAHKHVPLMEANVVEAVTNNVGGTRNLVDAALRAGTPHFVLISTDKAVRPTSVMGACKRAAEMLVQRAALEHGRNYVSVRFGNVLGSRGSVVPTFLRQIAAGGPVTVTHPEMRRYFMTIPEAVQLVLQAGALGAGGEVFVLDMGDPMRVVDLAGDLIRLSGLKEGADIEITFSGVRPGEKLYEEMFFSGEHVLPTDHPKVLRARHAACPAEAAAQLERLIEAAGTGEPERALRRMLGGLVPDFTGTGVAAAHEAEPGVGAQPVLPPQPVVPPFLVHPSPPGGVPAV